MREILSGLASSSSSVVRRACPGGRREDGRTDPLFSPPQAKVGRVKKERDSLARRRREAKHRGQGKVRPKSPCQQRKQGKNAFSRESSRATYVCCTRQGPKNSPPHIPPPDRYSLFWPRMRSIVSHSHLEVSGETRRCYSRIFLITRRRGSTWPKEKSTLVEVKDLWTNKGV